MQNQFKLGLDIHRFPAHLYLLTGSYHNFLIFYPNILHTFKKVFIKFLSILLLLYSQVFWPRSMQDLSSPTRDQTCTPALEGEFLTTGPLGKSTPQPPLHGYCSHVQSFRSYALVWTNSTHPRTAQTESYCSFCVLQHLLGFGQRRH